MALRQCSNQLHTIVVTLATYCLVNKNEDVGIAETGQEKLHNVLVISYDFKTYLMAIEMFFSC